MAKPSLLARTALTSALVVVAGSAAASETRCVRGDDTVRRVEIHVQDPGPDVPCEVVYWKDTEDPGVRSVLWSAQTDAGFCASKAEDLVDTLRGAGWSCAAAGEEPRAASRQVPAAPSPQPDAAEPPAAEDRAVAPTSQGADSRNAAPARLEALTPPRDAASSDQEAPDDAPAASALDAIIEQNLDRLNDGVDGQFAAEIGDYGDLDGDGLDDGLVFFTYESKRLGKARFVAAYLFDGENYALAATKPLAGSEDSVHSAEIESIDEGVISLRLNVLEPGDASCCPSGLRRQELVLRGGQLIEARSASTAQGRS